MGDDYDRLERSERTPKRVVDHTAKWAKLEPVGSVNGQVEERLKLFCASKRISVDGLEALGARVVVRRGNKVELAFAGENGAGAVTAIKYRPLDGSSHDSYAENPSTWLRPIIAGKRDSLNWLIAEGETDGARLVGLVGDAAAVMALPAGAPTFKREWAALIPRGATVALCHDADEDGDAGAEKAARIVGGRTLRVRPPVEGGDWCDWEGSRDELLELLAAASRDDERPFSLTLGEFVALERPKADPLVVDTDGRTVIARKSLTLLGALGGHGKTTLFVELALHGAAGVDYLCFRIPEPFSTLLVENEGPEDEFARKLEDKLASFPHELKVPVRVHTFDWGGFSLADSPARERLRQDIAEHEYDLVFGDPLDSLGIEGVGSPEDTRKFLELMKECGLNSHVAWWLNTHPRKEETKEALNEISGAWGGKPDAVLLLKMLADDRSRLRFPKLRWAKRGTRPTILLGFDVETESFSYVGEDDGVERDYLGELKALMRSKPEREWWTPTELARKDEGGIGAGTDTVKEVLGRFPDVFAMAEGAMVERPRAPVVYRLRDTDETGS
jgi:hypothetical protein